MKDEVYFVKPERVAAAPVRVSLVLNRELYEKAEQAARFLGKGTLQNLIVHLLERTVAELEASGVELKPFWEVD